MQLERFIDALEAELASVAAVGDEQSQAAAERLSRALRSAAGLRFLELLSEAALELSAQLPSGHAELRLTGGEPSLVYVEETEAPQAPAGEEGLSARITLRLPEPLKTSIEAAAAREGISVNAWLVRALARSVSSPSRRRAGTRLTGYAKS
ncbi:MAG TPA: toxin-antitoxin system HicB family antitoxin [Gaiellaceae bacterium]|nr:toxin-antitoxin system HicB family antitoxin [Gaiellaceae bacterium]